MFYLWYSIKQKQTKHLNKREDRKWHFGKPFWDRIESGPNTGSVAVHCASPRAKVLHVWMWHQLEKGIDQSGHRLPFALYQNPQLTWGQPTHQPRTLQRFDGSAGGCRDKKTPQDLTLCAYFHLRGPSNQLHGSAFQIVSSRGSLRSLPLVRVK